MYTQTDTEGQKHVWHLKIFK